MYNYLFVGLSTLDIGYGVQHYPIENTKVKCTENMFHTGGPATNAAVVCAALGGNTTLATLIGNNHFNRFMLNDIKAYGVKLLDAIEGHNAQPVMASIITNVNNGHRTVLSNQPANNHHCFNNIRIDKHYHVALFDGFYPDLVKQIRKQGSIDTVVFDGGSWKPHIPELLPHIDIAICSNDFFPPGCSSVTEVMAYLQQYGITKIAITHGNKEIKACIKNNYFMVSVPEVKAVDTLGAGDFFHGAFCYFYPKFGFKQALTRAAEVASESCKLFGTRTWLQQLNVKI